MKIKIKPAVVLQAAKVLRTLIKALPGGISKDEAQEIGAELLDLGAALLGEAIHATD